MAGEKSIPTVYDVAREAGVSRGTVDRVIHKRGRYSAESEARVREAIQRLGYFPNLNAAKLSARKVRRIACLVPAFKEGEYWDYINRGFREEARTSGFNLELEMFLYNQTDADSFNEMAYKLLDSNPDAVILNAVFKEDVLRFVPSLTKRCIPYAFIDNKVDNTDYMLYVGVDSRRCGELGAFLLLLTDMPKEILLVRILRDKKHKGDPNRERRQGFLDYIQANRPETIVDTVFIDPEVPESIAPELEKFLAEHPNVRHLATTNSRIHLLAPFLSAHPEIRAVGFDYLEKNLQALRSGQVTFLVTHEIEGTARQCLRLVAESLSSNAAPSSRNNYIHLDILHRLNLDSDTSMGMSPAVLCN